jgi:hypothetical protein
MSNVIAPDLGTNSIDNAAISMVTQVRCVLQNRLTR